MTAAPSILIVDDEPDICSNLSDILTDLGYACTTAHNGQTALELVGQQTFDVALLDLRMPDMTGVELYRRIKEQRRETVAMIVTAYANIETRAAALECGAWRVLSKPISMQSLLPLIEETLRQPLLLVVDDDQELCQNLWDIFRGRGYRTCLAHDIESAKPLLAERNFDVCLIDVRLPDGDGTSMVQMARNQWADVRTVIISGDTDQIDPMLAGADGVCYKPFDIPGLLSMVERLVVRDKPD